MQKASLDAFFVLDNGDQRSQKSNDMTDCLASLLHPPSFRPRSGRWTGVNSQ